MRLRPKRHHVSVWRLRKQVEEPAHEVGVGPAEVQPGSRVESRALPAPGPLTAALAARYASAARGGPDARPGWLEIIA